MNFMITPLNPYIYFQQIIHFYVSLQHNHIVFQDYFVSVHLFNFYLHVHISHEVLKKA